MTSGLKPGRKPGGPESSSLTGLRTGMAPFHDPNLTQPGPNVVKQGLGLFVHPNGISLFAADREKREKRA